MKAGIYIKALLLFYLMGSASAVSATIAIDSIRATPSNCANDGSIAVYAHSPSSMVFAIISGPDIRPAQSGSLFGALPIGNYQIRVTNFSNDTALVNATVGGTYQFPDFSMAFTNPTCLGSYDGVIAGIADSGTGRPPYTWELTNTNTGVVTIQNTDTFFNLNDGDYSLRFFDSCNAFATRFVSIAAPYNSFSLGYIYPYFTACDTAVVAVTITPTNGVWVNPYVISTFAGGQSRTDTFNFSGNFAYPGVSMGGMTYGSGGYMVVNNGCGLSQVRGFSTDPWDANVSVGSMTASCQYVATVNFRLTYNFFPTTSFWGPVTFQVWDSTAHIKIDSTVLTGSVSGYYPTYHLEPGHYYRMVVYDECGNYTAKMFTPPLPDTTHTVYVNKLQQSCMDSTGAVNIYCAGFGEASTTLTILSGPAFIRSTKPHFSYYDTIIYPKTGFPVNSSCTGYTPGQACFGVGDLAKGIYTYRITDTCGYVYTDTFAITDDDLNIYSFEKTVTKGCPGQNKVNYLLRNNRYYTVLDYVKLIALPGGNAVDSLTLDSASFLNLDAGTYQIRHPLNPYHSFVRMNENLDCFTFYDTVIIPPYQTPSIDYATQTKCNGTVNVGFQPDSSKGVPPYRYEILSGPQTSPIQSSQFFIFSQPGNYVARISDTCGFARTFNFYVDTLSFQQIVKVGSSCLGNSATLVCQHSPYATYVWHKPNGGIYVGDSLQISPVTPADYGTYQIEKIVAVNNCTDTFYTTYLLNSSSITYQTATICNHQSYSFGGDTYTVSGTYYDTIATTLCDSIVVLNLTVGGFVYDTVYQSICSGQSITVGPNTYSATGVYQDTFTTTGCDSVRILNLQVGNYKRDSVTQTICNGGSITIGSIIYTAAGIYRDTFSTATCDSIFTFNLIVANTIRDSVSQTICNGQSITIGSNTYSAAGIYRDTFTTGGCDSIRILNLQLSNYKRDSVTQKICSGGSVTVGANTYTAAGIYRDTFPTASCDSIHILNLIVLGAKRDTISIAFCEGESATVGNKLYTQEGSYTDTILTASCDSLFTVIVATFSKPIVQVSASETEVDAGDVVQLDASSTQLLNYLWTSVAVINNQAIQNPFVTVTEPAWVILQVSDTNNCTATDSVFIALKECAENMYVPNAFTPNGDGTNDVFYVYGKCIQLYHLSVFNRWGEKMWDTNNINKGWDGYHKGVMQPMGVYVYLINYAAGTGVGRTLKGSVTLIR